MTDTNLTGTSANYDWGVYNAISNGGNCPGMWRTLTLEEWNYLFYVRSTSSGIRYAFATVNGVAGVIIVPDNWSITTYSLVVDSTATYASNVIPYSRWIALDNAGCVFLPAAGYRQDYLTGNSVAIRGDYWSVSKTADFLGGCGYQTLGYAYLGYAYYAHFGQYLDPIIGHHGVFTWGYSWDCLGFSVRLVQNAE